MTDVFKQEIKTSFFGIHQFQIKFCNRVLNGFLTFQYNAYKFNLYNNFKNTISCCSFLLLSGIYVYF